MQRANRLLLYIMDGSEAGQVGGLESTLGHCCFFYLRASQLLPHLPQPPHTDPARAVVPPPPNSTTEVTTDPARLLFCSFPSQDGTRPYYAPPFLWRSHGEFVLIV